MIFPLPTLRFVITFSAILTFGQLNAQNPLAAGNNGYPNGVPLDNDQVSIIDPSNMQLMGGDTTDANGNWQIDSLFTAIRDNGFSITPESFELYPAFPNPGRTHNLIYETAKPALVTLEIYDVLGRKVQTLVKERKSANLYIAQWDGKNEKGLDVAEGVYFAVLSNGAQTRTLKLLKMGETQANYIGNLSEYIAHTSPNPKLQRLAKRMSSDYLIKYHDLQGRTEDLDTLMNLPNTNIQQVRNEIIEWIGPAMLQIAEGDTGMLLIWNTINAPTGIANITSNIPDLFEISIIGDTLWYWTTNPDTNSQNHGSNLPLELMVEATNQTQKVTGTIINILPMTDNRGYIKDNDNYMGLTDKSGPNLPGVLLVNEQEVFYTDSLGYFDFQTEPQDSNIIKATAMNGLDTASFVATFRIPGNEDQNDLKLNVVPFNGIEGQEALFKQFYHIVNNDWGNFNYYGKKYIDKDNPSENIYWIPRVDLEGDTASVADQDSVEQFLLEHIIPGQQIPMNIYKATLQDTMELGHGGGRIYVIIRPFGNASGGTQDFDHDGKIDEAYVKFPKLGGNFYWPWLSQEVFTTEAGPNELSDITFQMLTVLQNASPLIDPTTFDKKLRKIGENYPPLEGIENILGGIQMSTTNKPQIKKYIQENQEKNNQFINNLYKTARNNPRTKIKR